MPVKRCQACRSPILLTKIGIYYREHFRGADAVAHFGFVGNTNPSAGNDSEVRFWNEFANVQMAYNIYQTALEEGVRRVVVASSNHAADYYEPLILDGQLDFVDPNGPSVVGQLLWVGQGGL